MLHIGKYFKMVDISLTVYILNINVKTFNKPTRLGDPLHILWVAYSGHTWCQFVSNSKSNETSKLSYNIFKF